MRECRTERQRADHDPERRAASIEEPSGGNLETRRVDECQRHTRRSSQEDDDRARRGEGDRRVGNRSCQAPPGEQMPRIDDVGEVEKRADECPGNESALNRHRQPRQACARDREFRGDGRCRGRGREPECHAEKKPEGDERQHDSRHLKGTILATDHRPGSHGSRSSTRPTPINEHSLRPSATGQRSRRHRP